MISEAVVATPMVVPHGLRGVPGGRSPGPAPRVLAGRGDEAHLAAELARERHVVLTLQHAILPVHERPFDLPGLRTAVRYLPAAQGSRVGGDWYIAAEMPDGTVLLAIGDVAGHGLEAAAGMARLRGALAGLAITGASPERLVGWLNDLVWHVAPEHTASVIAGSFDPQSRMLIWSQAGHPPPLLVRAGSATPVDQPRGVLLGAGQDSYELATLKLRRDDLLLLYSDGLIERRDRCIDEGVALLADAVRGATDPELMISAALCALGAADADDDTCLVALAVR
jgi:serine phosphatase RsbU (regulator of sigma subunit)